MATQVVTYDITVWQGSALSLSMALTNSSDNSAVDITGWSAEMKVRQKIGYSAILITLSSANGKITLGGTAGTIVLNLSASDTAALTTSGVYDLVMTNNSGQVYPPMVQGNFIVLPKVTR